MDSYLILGMIGAVGWVVMLIIALTRKKKINKLKEDSKHGR